MTRQEQMEALGFTQWEIKQVIADERRRMVVRLRDAGLTARQIADRMGVSRSRPGQLEMRALHARSSVLERRPPHARWISRRLCDFTLTCNAAPSR